MSTNVHSRAVQRAAELAGGRSALAERLEATKADIDAWIAGERKPGLPVLLQVVELILDETDDPKLSR